MAQSEGGRRIRDEEIVVVSKERMIIWRGRTERGEGGLRMAGGDGDVADVEDVAEGSRADDAGDDDGAISNWSLEEDRLVEEWIGLLVTIVQVSRRGGWLVGGDAQSDRKAAFGGLLTETTVCCRGRAAEMRATLRVLDKHTLCSGRAIWIA
ncbi:hypothetical protein Ct61P_15024 [Colletotrichum tofieldiae]|nr:hypothetical protein Ct61P_15024 [Colletotrichum tofieldiae]